MSNAVSSGRHALEPHPATPCAAVRGLTLAVARPTPARLTLDYRLDGDVAALRIPPAHASLRTDGLWKHTCFEAFIGERGGGAYWEYNFSPSGAWAAYQFTGYREGMAALLKGAAPIIETRESPGSLEVGVTVDLGWLERATAAELVLGAAAVLETRDRTLSYWALKHAAAKPDFHHGDSFILPLD